MPRPLIVALVTFVTACAPLASSSSPDPTMSGTVTATPSAAPSTTRPSGGPSQTPIPLPSGAFVAAASGGVVWMYVNGDHLFVSLNRGDTWTEKALAPGLRSSLAAISAGEGWWLAVGSPGTQCTFQDVTIWKTDDGAMTWRKLDATGLDNARCKDAIQFSGPSVGYLPVSDSNSAPAIYRTSDGGRSLTLSRPLPDPPGFTTKGAGVTLHVGNIGDFGSVTVADAFGPSNGALRHFVYRSTDGGATWSFDSAAPSTAPIVFVTAARWIQPQPHDSRETTDAGRTWHSYTTDYSTAAPVAPQFVFGDADTGYATVRGTLQRTTDGGVHWTAIKTPGT